MIEEMAIEFEAEQPSATARSEAQDLYHPSIPQTFEIKYSVRNRVKTRSVTVDPVTDEVLISYQLAMPTKLRATGESFADTTNPLSLEAGSNKPAVLLFDTLSPSNADLPDEVKEYIVRESILFTATQTPLFLTDDEAAGYPPEGNVVLLLAKYNNVPINTEHIFRDATAADRREYQQFGGKTVLGASVQTGEQDIYILAKPAKLKQLYLRLILEHRGYSGGQIANVPLHHMTAALQEFFKVEVKLTEKNA